jgi:hypothetical protein
VGLGSKHRKVLEAVFSEPVPADIRWTDIESLLIAAGATVKSGAGSRYRASLNGRKASIHKPHSAQTPRGTVRDIREFLEEAGVVP